MKKLVSLVLVLAMVFCLASCGNSSKEETATLTTEQNGAKVEMTLKAKGDKIEKIDQVSTISLDGYTEDQVKTIEDSVASFKAQYDAISGVTYSSDVTDKELKETISMDVSNKDTLKTLIDQKLLPVTNKNTDKLSMKATKKALTDAGWTLK